MFVLFLIIVFLIVRNQSAQRLHREAEALRIARNEAAAAARRAQAEFARLEALSGAQPVNQVYVVIDNHAVPARVVSGVPAGCRAVQPAADCGDVSRDIGPSGGFSVGA